MARFTLAWADIAKENNLLKTLTLSLMGLTLCLGILTMRLALRDPLIIERSCSSKSLSTVSGARTEDEIQNFLKDAIIQRFNSEGTSNSDLLSIDESNARDLEQAELKRREMKQRVLVNRITKNGETFVADTDRLLSVGSIRSAFIFPVVLEIQSTSRTVTNPYGLVLIKTKSIAADAKDAGAHEK